MSLSDNEVDYAQFMCQQGGADLVRQCAMVGVWNPERADEDVILFVEWASDKRQDAKWLLSVSTRVCGIQAQPDYCFGLRQFPVTGRQNKLDKKALRHKASLLLQRDPDGGYQHG